MVVLDIAIVNVALPLDLDRSGASRQENLQWVISAYALVFGGFLLLGGRAADMLGRRRMFLSGLVLFTARLARSPVSPGREASLITARSLQGLGAAVITPAALSILSVTFLEGRERNIALGAWGAVGGFGAVAGVLLGGVLTDAFELGVDLLRQRAGRHCRARRWHRSSCDESRDATCRDASTSLVPFSLPPGSSRSCTAITQSEQLRLGLGRDASDCSRAAARAARRLRRAGSNGTPNR